MIILEETSRAKKAAITPDNVGLIASHTHAPTATSFNRTNRGGGNNNRGRGGSGRGHHGLYHCTYIHNNNGLIHHMITKINNGIFHRGQKPRWKRETRISNLVFLVKRNASKTHSNTHFSTHSL